MNTMNLDFAAPGVTLARSKLAPFYRNLARRCGHWAIGRHLLKIGYSIDEARELLFG